MAGVRLDKFLAEADRCGSRGRAVRALERGKVFVNGAEAGIDEAARRLAGGDLVRLWMDRPGSATRRPRTGPAGDLDVVYEDDRILVVNKPAGLLAVPLERKGSAPSVREQIADRFRSFGRSHGRRPFVVHRIDQDTSGLVMFAKDVEAQRALVGQFRRREPVRAYLAVVHGHPDPARGTWRDRLVWDAKALVQKPARSARAGDEAVSDYRVVERLRGASLLDVRLRTGRRNQIRIQAALRGHPLVGERRYVGGGPTLPIHFERQALHAWRLAFRHPGDGRSIALEAPVPDDLADLVARLQPRRSRQRR
jgi:23S rRNA pseudouridine1911/1915/1917 synthase